MRVRICGAVTLIASAAVLTSDFVPLGVEQQITEMNVSIYTANPESLPAPPADRLLKQAHVYRDTFALFSRHATAITSVTL
jgi:endo-1,4-beta-xylanase